MPPNWRYANDEQSIGNCAPQPPENGNPYNLYFSNYGDTDMAWRYQDLKEHAISTRTNPENH
jgi:hypothetical protein